MKRTASISKILLPTLALLSSAVVAQESEQGEAAGNTGSAAAQANNPLADMTAFNIQDYYIGAVSYTHLRAHETS